MKKLKNFKKNSFFPSFLVFADLRHEGGLGGTFCIKDELKFRTQGMIWAIFKKILRPSFGGFSGKKRVFFSFFKENPPNGQKYGKMMNTWMKRLAKPHNSLHHELRQKINFTPSKWQKTRFSKNGRFSAADFYHVGLADFPQILTEHTQGR